jgi:hypothetical protein
MDVYSINRAFWDYAFANPDKIRPNHCAILFFAIEHCNRLGWKDKFGFPTSMAMEATGIKSYSVYKKAFDELVDFGFFDVKQYSRNQYSSNIIALNDSYKAPSKALDKALIKHISKQVQSTLQSTLQSTHQSNCSIYNTNIQDTNIPIATSFSFKNSLIELGVEKSIVEDWIIVRKEKKFANTKTAFSRIKNEIEKSGLPANECIKIAVEKSWGNFDAQYLENLKNSKKTSPVIPINKYVPPVRNDINDLGNVDYKRYNEMESIKQLAKSKTINNARQRN